MHWIQKHILRELATNAACRYITLKPKDVEGNLFMYHLQQLKKEGLLYKEGHSYTLSDKGKTFVSHMSLAQGTPRLQPKIVIMFVCQNPTGEHLLFKWKRQPYYGLISFPFGKLHFGRPVADQLEEELFYKTNLQGDFTFLGDIHWQIHKKGQAIDHLLAHIYKITPFNYENLWSDGLVGQPLWARLSEIPHNEFIPGFQKIVQLTNNKQGFIHDITVDICFDIANI